MNAVGRELCDLFFSGYTRKQWGCELSDLSASVAARIPIWINSDDRYFTERFQAMSLNGCTAMFERMLNHPGIEVDFKACSADYPGVRKIYTGPIDCYFDCCYGGLPCCSLRFEHCHFGDFGLRQPVGAINYPNEFDSTRVAEFRNLTGQWHQGDSLVYGCPEAIGDSCCPIPHPGNEALCHCCLKLDDRQDDVVFVGRLAQYRCCNLDQVVAAALHVAESP